ncbi:MAG: hypothetical protein J7M38_04055, partial [Armatimonadetes bacterium]|nr:hypothetical protein [Armatimonadota bacterium]
DKYALYAIAANGSSLNPGLFVIGYATITGDISTTMLTSAGLARTHNISSPKAEFSFSGSSRLSYGEAEVTFAPTWQDCISDVEEYRVLITPTEMCNGICVVEKTPTGFKVKELMNGSSNASFDWMVRAVKKGSATEKILLAGAGKLDLGMEIIDEAEERIMQAMIEKQKAMDEKQKEKSKAPLSQAPALLSAKEPMDLREGPQAIAKTSPEMEQRIQQVKEYREKLRQRVLNK